MNRIDLSTAPSAMEEAARAWSTSSAPAPRPAVPTPRALPPRRVVQAPVRIEAKPKPSPYQPPQTESDRDGDAALAQEDFRRHIATGIPDAREKARLLTPAEAEAMVNTLHTASGDRYLRPDTDAEVARSLFAIGCVGKRGADRRLWLGPYGTKVRKALIGVDGG